MRLLFVRHALALERDEWNGDDLERPLDEKGVKNANSFFKKVKKIYPNADAIITSKATRAVETAKMLLNFYPSALFIKDERLNPGATFNDFQKILKELDKHIETLFIIGHEPDLSEIISELICDSHIRIKLKKPSLAEIEVEGKKLGELRALLYPKMLKEF